MPWSIQQRDGKYCVIKQGSSSPVPGGCHATRAKALRHQRALYANEPSMTAAAKPPASFFSTPEPNGPQPLTITADGHVSGHLALWNQCHTGFSECVQAPRGDTFDQFHVGAVEDEDGNMVAVGKIVYDAKHADLGMVAATASRHYDDNGHVGAYVRAVNGRHGIWLSGVTRPGIDEDGLITMRANPPSGDWRSIGNRLSLIAALAVPVPGFPVTRAMAASGALILEGYDGESEEIEEILTEPRSKEYLRQRALIASSLKETP